MAYSTSVVFQAKKLLSRPDDSPKQASGAVLVRCGETMVLVTAVAEKRAARA